MTLAGERCIVAGGAGAVGGLMVDLLCDEGADVLAVDVAGAAPGDVAAPDAGLRRELRRAGMLVLAVPERVALAALPQVAPELPRDALLVDTLSVKARIAAALAEHAEPLEALGLNPLFAPSLGFEGHAVAAVVVRDGPRSRALLAAVARRGARVTRLDAEEHDRLASATQALTHAAVLAFGLALDELDVDVARLGALAPPPHLAMLALLARILSGAPETYWDVQVANPHADRARSALAGGLATLSHTADLGDFTAALERARRRLGPNCDAYAGLGARLLAAANPPASLDPSRSSCP